MPREQAESDPCHLSAGRLFVAACRQNDSPHDQKRLVTTSIRGHVTCTTCAAIIAVESSELIAAAEAVLPENRRGAGHGAFNRLRRVLGEIRFWR